MSHQGPVRVPYGCDGPEGRVKSVMEISMDGCPADLQHVCELIVAFDIASSVKAIGDLIKVDIMFSHSSYFFFITKKCPRSVIFFEIYR